MNVNGLVASRMIGELGARSARQRSWKKQEQEQGQKQKGRQRKTLITSWPFIPARLPEAHTAPAAV